MIVKIIYAEASKDSLADVEYIDAKNCVIMDNKSIGDNDEGEYVTLVINDRQSPYEVHKKRGRIVIINDEGKIIDVHLSNNDMWNQWKMKSYKLTGYEHMGVRYYKHTSGYYYLPSVSMKFKTHNLIKDWIETDINGEF